MHEFTNLDKLQGKLSNAPGALIPGIFKTFSDLISTFSPAAVPGRIAEYLPGLMACPDLLTPEQRSLKGLDYEKHEVFLCPNDGFSVLAVVWPAGIYSPIHDHKTWCTFGVLEGEIRETIYEETQSANCDACAVSSTNHLAGSITHMTIDESNIHCMHNPGAVPAVTIHIYGGNFKKIGANVNQIYATHT